MKVTFGPRELDLGGKYLNDDLRESNDIVSDVEALRDRLDEDGYLLIRGLHERELVLTARRQILEKLANQGKLDPTAPLMDGVINPALEPDPFITVRKKEELKSSPALQQLVKTGPVMDFFERLLGGAALTFNFQWLRVAGKGASSPVHSDGVFMGRGTRRLYTCWTPLGDLSVDMGPVAICLGSHRFEKVQQTYAQMDVDRDLIQGFLTTDPAEVVDKFGGRWATSSYQAGDALIFGIDILHASLTNSSDKYRISVDTRYQLASEPVDDRWVGEKPLTHYAFWKEGVQLEPIEVSHAKWGI